MGNSIGKTFWSVLGWTLIWAVLATFLNYILGMILAIVINRKTTRIKGFWRFCFMLSAAIPQFVSLLLMRTMFKGQRPDQQPLGSGRSDQQSASVPDKCDLGESNGCYHQPLGWYSVYHDAGYRYLTEHSG